MRNAQKALWLLHNGHQRPFAQGDSARIPLRRTYTDQDSTLSNRCSRGVISDASYSGACSER